MMSIRLQQLLAIYHSGDLTEDQRRELVSLLDSEEAEALFAGVIVQQLSNGEFSLEGDLPGTEARIVGGVMEKISIVRVVPVRGASFFRQWGWAAAVLLAIAGGVFWWKTGREAHSSLAVEHAQLQQGIDPGGNKAVLTLSDGTSIVLDSAANGAVAKQGNVAIVKLADGRLSYSLQGAAKGAVMMNNMRTPRGGQYRLVLPDGTQVWLNAASSISYPAAFVEKTRRVRISGEVYFEVAKNKEQPFVVDVEGGPSVEVLGTGFDVNAYTDEGSVKTTLLEGSVRVDHVVLKPGQQARMGQQGLSIEQNVNIDKVMAWKNGYFNFENASLKEVMRQLQRWYDITVVYEGRVPDIQFEGEISRNINLSNLLRVLARADVKFRLEEGRRLVVLP